MDFVLIIKFETKIFRTKLFLKRELIRDQKNFLKKVVEEMCSKIIKVCTKLLT